jgi:alpha-1,2-mannosyltransferase
MFVSFPVAATLKFVSVSGVVTVAFMVAGWRLRNRSWAGALLGTAAAIKLWPLLVIAALWVSGRRRIVYLAMGTFVGLNVAGAMLPGVTWQGSFQTLLEAQHSWLVHPHNASLAMLGSFVGIPPIVITVGLVGL